MRINPGELEATEQAEEALLGSILIEASGRDRTAINAVAQIVQPADFHGYWPTSKDADQPQRIRIYMAMLSCAEAPEPVSVPREMNRLGILKGGDCAYCSHLISIVPCSLDYMFYAHAVKDYSTRRQVKYHAEMGNMGKLRQLTKRNDFEEGISL